MLRRTVPFIASVVGVLLWVHCTDADSQEDDPHKDPPPVADGAENGDDVGPWSLIGDFLVWEFTDGRRGAYLGLSPGTFGVNDGIAVSGFGRDPYLLASAPPEVRADPPDDYFEPGDLAALGGTKAAPSIARLDLHGVTLNDADVAGLQEMVNMRELSLDVRGGPNVPIETLSTLRDLTHLSIRCRDGSPVLAELTALKTLRVLDVAACTGTAVALPELIRLPHIESITLRSFDEPFGLDANGLPEGLRRLTRLDVWSLTWTAELASALANARRLTFLRVSSDLEDDSAVALVRQCPIVDLAIDDETAFSAALARAIAESTTLRSLSLPASWCTTSALRQISESGTIEKLQVSIPVDASDAWAALAKGFSQINGVSVTLSGEQVDALGELLSARRDLRSLSIYSRDNPLPAGRVLRCLAPLHKLEVLRLDSKFVVDEYVFAEVIAQLQLRELYCTGLSDRHLAVLGPSSLQLLQAGPVSSSALQTAREKNPSLAILHF